MTPRRIRSGPAWADQQLRGLDDWTPGDLLDPAGRPDGFPPAGDPAGQSGWPITPADLAERLAWERAHDPATRLARGRPWTR